MTDIVSKFRSNWRSLLGLALLLGVGPMCGGGGGGGGGSSGGPSLPPFNVTAKYPTTGGQSRTQTVYITVNGTVDLSTLNNTNITVTGKTNIPISLSINSLGQIELTPQSGAWDDNFNHVVNVFAGLKTTGGSAMTPSSFNFGTVSAADLTAPSPPVTPAAGTSTVNSVPLSWNDGTDETTGQGGLFYDIWYTTTSGVTDFARDPDKTTFPTGGQLTFTVPSLASYTQYYFVVRTRDAAGNRSTNIAQVAAKTKISFQTNIYNAIVNNGSAGHCTNCHTPGGLGEFMVLSISASDAVSKWVDVIPDTGTNSTQACQNYKNVQGERRIKPYDTSLSLVYEKISPGTPGCGMRMPEDGASTRYLTSQEIQAFADWINEGANDN